VAVAWNLQNADVHPYHDAADSVIESCPMKIANAKGVPGTLGGLARFVDPLGTPCTVLLTTWHTLFANHASWQDAIWLVDERAGRPRYRQLGRTLLGKIGTVRVDGEEYFVDCAAGSCFGLSPAASKDVSSGLPAIAGINGAVSGMAVKKTGAGTGTTHGVIVDTAYCGSVCIDGRTQPAPRQLLVRSSDGTSPFSDAGDSGALVIDEDGRALGLVWGSTTAGDGVACPIGPVLQALNLTFEADGV
jgi:hypothetical protein